MKYQYQLRVTPEAASKTALLRRDVSTHSGIPEKEITHIQVVKRSIDARQKAVMINLKVDVYVNEPFAPEDFSLPEYPQVGSCEEVFIIGAGPAGLFAAMRCIELGKKPIVIERGKMLDPKTGSESPEY